MASLFRKKVLDHYEPRHLFEGWTRDGEKKKSRPRPGQYQVEGGYQNLLPEVIYDLLDKAKNAHRGYSSQPALVPVRARELFQRMADETWTCVSTPHEEGFASGGVPPDKYTHFGIAFRKPPTTYHVKCHEHDQGGLVVFMVTFIDKTKARG